MNSHSMISSFTPQKVDQLENDILQQSPDYKDLLTDHFFDQPGNSKMDPADVVKNYKNKIKALQKVIKEEKQYKARLQNQLFEQNQTFIDKQSEIDNLKKQLSIYNQYTPKNLRQSHISDATTKSECSNSGKQQSKSVERQKNLMQQVQEKLNGKNLQINGIPYYGLLQTCNIKMGQTANPGQTMNGAPNVNYNPISEEASSLMYSEQDGPNSSPLPSREKLCQVDPEECKQQILHQQKLIDDLQSMLASTKEKLIQKEKVQGQLSAIQSEYGKCMQSIQRLEQDKQDTLNLVHQKDQEMQVIMHELQQTKNILVMQKQNQALSQPDHLGINLKSDCSLEFQDMDKQQLQGDDLREAYQMLKQQVACYKLRIKLISQQKQTQELAGQQQKNETQFKAAKIIMDKTPKEVECYITLRQNHYNQFLILVETLQQIDVYQASQLQDIIPTQGENSTAVKIVFKDQQKNVQLQEIFKLSEANELKQLCLSLKQFRNKSNQFNQFKLNNVVQAQAANNNGGSLFNKLSSLLKY